MAPNVFSCSSPADCYQRSVVQLLAAGGVSMGNMSEQHDLISVIFCSGVVFSALSNMKPNLPVPSDSPVKNSPHCCSIYSPQMFHYKLGEAIYLKE